MEREENNSHLDNYLQNSQNLMDNLQNASGGGVGVGVGGIGGNCSDVNAGFNVVAGAKFEEHEDDEEWKYIKEVQQSEKKSELIDNGNETLGADILLSNNTIGIGNGYRNNNNSSNGNGVDVDLLLDAHQEQNQQQQQQQHEYDNGLAANGANIIGGFAVSGAANINENLDDFILRTVAVTAASVFAVDEEDVDVIKNDGDFSTTSNTTTTSTAGEEIDNNILQVEMKIEAAQPLQLDDDDLLSENFASQYGASTAVNIRNEVEEEDEPSSMATNTTNGTSSLSENIHQQQHELQNNLQQDQENIPNAEFDFDDKENADPLNTTNDTHESILNPNAREFVPSFASNPTSPDLIEAESFSEQEQEAPSAVPRHLFDIGADDFVAQSPSKTRCTDMDTISIPAENDFDHEAAKRPHELERSDDILGDDDLTQNVDADKDIVDEVQQLTLNADFEQTNNSYNDLMKDEVINTAEIDSHSPSSFIDHGPETSVDLDTDIDVMKQSIYIANSISETNENIEDLLNTVQLLPNDSESANNSFIGFEEEVEAVAGKELLNVEEKELLSQSPTIEDIHMNFKNDEFNIVAENFNQEILNNDLQQQETLNPTIDIERKIEVRDEEEEEAEREGEEFNYSTQNIAQIPLDMNNAAHMQESFYIENTSADRFVEGGGDADGIIEVKKQLELDEQQQQHQENEQTLYNVQDNVNEHANLYETEAFVVAVEPPNTLNIIAANAEQEQQQQQLLAADDATPSPYSSEEKHLLEETKEQFVEIKATTTSVIANGSDEIEQKLNDLQLSNNANLNADYDDDVVPKQTTTNIVEIENQFFTQESEPQQQQLIFEETKNIVDELEQQEANNEQYLQYEQEVTSLLQPKSLLTEFENEIPNVEEIQQPSNDNISIESQEIISKKIEEVAADPLKNAVEPVVETIAAPIEIEPILSQPSSDTSFLDAAAAAASAAVGVTTVTIAKKSDVLKKSPSVASKTSITQSKKAAVDAKKTTATKPLSARPRTAPIATKTTTTTSAAAANDKKPATAPKVVGIKKTTTTATSRNPITAASKTSAGTGAAATQLKSTTSAARVPLSTTSTRRLTTTTSTSSTNKTRPTTAPAKPTSLSLSSTGGTASATASKTKVASPRMTLTTQLRKTAPTTASAAKSPTKTASAANGGVATKSSIINVSSRPKTATGTGTSNTALTTATKPFTARPAPKFTHSTISSTVSATRRTNTSGTSITKTTSATTATVSSSTTNIKKTSGVSAATRSMVGKTSSPGKTTTATAAQLKNKTKDSTAAAGAKSHIIGRKSIGGPIKIDTNNIIKQSNGITDDTSKDLLQLNGNDSNIEQHENGVADNSGEQFVPELVNEDALIDA